MVKNGIIEKEDAELYCFGLDTLKTYLYAIVITLGIGLLMHSFMESIVFLISFKLLRTTAGGYHASSYLRCFWASSIVLVAALEIIKCNQQIPVWIWIVMLLASILTVFLLAPLPDDNKPINEKEHLYHRRKSRIVVILESIFVLLAGYHNRTLGATVLMAEVTVMALLIVWVILRKLQLNKDKDL